MATEKLLKAVITGPAGKLDETLSALVLDRQFHVTPANVALKSIQGLSVPDSASPYRPLLDVIVSYLTRLGVEPAFREFRDKGYCLEETTAYVKALTARLTKLLTKKSASESLLNDYREYISKLEPYQELPCDIGRLLQVERAEVRFGCIEESGWEALRAGALALDGVILLRSGQIGEKVYCVYIALPDCADQAVETFDSLDLEYIEKPDAPGIVGIPADHIRELTAASADLTRQIAALKEEIEAFIETEKETLLSRYSWLLFQDKACEMRANAAVKGNHFYLTGWIPSAEQEAFHQDAVALGVELAVEKPSRHDLDHAPVKFRTGFFSRIFAPFVDMYGYPAYGETDPRPFMTVTYALLFGIMFGDVGQGAVLILVGILMNKLKNMWLGRIVSWVGIFAVLFGFVYGSVFGNEHLLPGFKVMEGGNMMTTLIISVVVGAVLIVTCMILNIVTGFRQRDMKKALFSANGVAGMVFFISILLGLAGMFVPGLNLFGSKVFLIVCIGLPLLALFCADPLSKKCEGHKNWLPESWGMFFIEGFFDIFEACLSWFSNCVSFLRVGAYAICHAGMMMVVYLLSAAGDGGYHIWGLVLGNIVVMVIEAVLVCIQVLRLEFYELFGRFYSGRGTPFSPAVVDYAAAGSST